MKVEISKKLQSPLIASMATAMVIISLFFVLKPDNFAYGVLGAGQATSSIISASSTSFDPVAQSTSSPVIELTTSTPISAPVPTPVKPASDATSSQSKLSMLAAPNLSHNHSCTNLLNTNSPWAISTLPIRDRYETSQFIDFNGDGLTDYVNVFHWAVSVLHCGSLDRIAYNPGVNDHVYLNTGSGWEEAYTCWTDIDPVTCEVLYCGDCAQH